MNLARRRLPAFLAGLFILLCFARYQSAGAFFPALYQKASSRVLVDHTDRHTMEILQQMGATELVRYETFSLWQIPETESSTDQRHAALLQESALDLQWVDDSIYLRGLVLEAGQRNAPAAHPAVSNPSEGFWIVQWIGPTQDAWLEVLTAKGLTPVAYLPNNAYVVWGNHPSERLQALADQHNFISWHGPYLPLYRAAPELRPSYGPQVEDPHIPVDITVQVFNTPATPNTLAALQALALKIYQPPVSLAGFTTLSLQVPASALEKLLGWPDVFNIESWSVPEMQDEIQGQILAGNLATEEGRLVPASPGYLAWLDALGFPQDPSGYPIVDVMDDGIDTGNPARIMHPDFYRYGQMTSASRVQYLTNCTTDPLPNGVGGHGNLNAGIIAGYNNQAGPAYQDTAGFRYGLGISPYGQIAGTKMFRNDSSFELTQCGSSYAGAVMRAYANGARITSNSWGNNAFSALGTYSTTSQAYDIFTRDASADQPGNQPMLHIFSTGNSGSRGSGSVTPPGTAKNVITVGAAESVRDHGVPDRANHVNADNTNDITAFSSRGPTQDGRSKPDLVAPGIHITGPASQDPNFSGRTVLGTYLNRYYPANQTLYTWSSGTSHAAPAISGAAQLVYEYYQRVLQPGEVPSPAMVKALLINSTRYMTGTSANDKLPGIAQGWGSANLGMLMNGTARYLIDQTHVFKSTGNELVIRGGVADPTQPFRVSLVWTDAPGTPVGKAYVNNLDLEVTIGEQVYKGNAFSGPFSVPGGTFDQANNVENVFLPEGRSGTFQVRVVARNLAGDAIFDNTDGTDQDFALVIYNGSIAQIPRIGIAQVDSRNAYPILDIAGTSLPGDSILLDVTLSNQGNLAATEVWGTLEVISGQAVLDEPTRSYPDLLPGTAGTNRSPYRLTLRPDHPCGQPLKLILTIHYYPNQQVVLPIQLEVGVSWTETNTYMGPPLDIPDNAIQGIEIQLERPDTGGVETITDLNVLVGIQHTYTGDLDLTFSQQPSGISLDLSSDNGSSGDHYDQTLFDDEAQTNIATGTAPFRGSFRPEQPISVFTGLPANGIWELRIADDQSGNSGQVNTFALQFHLLTCDPNSPRLRKKQILPMILSLP